MSEPFYKIAATGPTALFIFADHASKHIPAELSHLGLSGEDLSRHIAWDIGTEPIVRALCAHFGCGGHVAGVSRLVIDVNRDPGCDSLIPLESDGTIILGNQNLPSEARARRIHDYYAPYHAGLALALDALTPHSFVISVHSFTPKPLTGARRETDIGLLVKHDENSAVSLQAAMKNLRPDFKVEINQPYSAYDLNYTIDHHVANRSMPHLAIEMRQDHIDTDQKAQLMTNLLIKAMTPLIAPLVHL